MHFVVITHVPHLLKDGSYYSYGPYVKEMNIWFKQVDTVTLVAPLSTKMLEPIDLPYQHSNLQFKAVPSLHIKRFFSLFQTFISLPQIFWTLYTTMKKADHIHLRCPGNMGLLGCLVQILFPNTPKTAKYAGNWDPKAKQPISYNWQKRILNSTFLTKNMQVLVYGEWENTSKNIKPFFTASYSESQKEICLPRSLQQPIQFVFVGTFSAGKRPLYAIQLVAHLKKNGVDVQLQLFGNGILYEELDNYIRSRNLSSFISLKGNRSKEEVAQALKESHFLLLPSQSEGWPKVVAEAMFWSCLPLTTNVSCVNYMIGNGTRGRLLGLDLQEDTQSILALLHQESLYQTMCEAARNWSQQYTLDYFEKEIITLVH